MKNLLLFLLLAYLLTSCCRRNIHTSVKYEVRDSVSITTQKRFVDTSLHIDSSVSIVKIICDSNNKPQIVSNRQTYGTRRTDITKINDSTFKMKNEADSLRLRINYLDSIIRSYRAEKMDTTVVVEQKKGFWAELGEVFRHIIYIVATGILFIVLFLFIRK